MISQAVEDRLIQGVEAITDVTVHIDPEDDEDAPTCRGLPMRGDAVAALREAWRGLDSVGSDTEIRLHYLSGRIEVELILPLSRLDEGAARAPLKSALTQAASSLPWFGGLRLLYG